MQYIKTDEHIHQLCQTIAKVNRTFVPKQDDDSHTNLYFNDMDARIVGRQVATKLGSLVFSLNLHSYEFEWLDLGKNAIQSFDIDGKTIAQFEDEIAHKLSDLGLDSKGFKDELHFEISDYSFKKEAFNCPDDDAMEEWMAYRSMGNQVCTLLAGHANINAEVRIWPHHFDTGVYFELPNGTGIGFGLAMSDSILNAPYLYMTAYPKNGDINYNEAPDLSVGQWHTSPNFSGALLNCNIPLEELQELFPEYLLTAYQWFANQTL